MDTSEKGSWWHGQTQWNYKECEDKTNLVIGTE